MKQIGTLGSTGGTGLGLGTRPGVAVAVVAIVSVYIPPNSTIKELASELVSSVPTIDSLGLGSLELSCPILDANKDLGENLNLPFLGLVTFNGDESDSLCLAEVAYTPNGVPTSLTGLFSCHNRFVGVTNLLGDNSNND